MPARNSQRDTAKAEYIKRRRAGEKINLKEFADRVGVPYGTVRNWKRIDQWDESLERKRGGQPGNRNSKGKKNAKGNHGGAPRENKNAEKDGAYSAVFFDKLSDEEFLSTPSARRATAKTERKPSAFVSLYTSLHKLQRGACKTNRKITPLLAQTAGIPVRSVWENHVRCLFALAGHQKISTLSCANSGCSPTCSTLVW